MTLSSGRLAAEGPTHVQGSFRDQAIAFSNEAKVLPRNISAFSAWRIKLLIQEV